MNNRRDLPESPYLAAASGRKPNRVPVWFMRQAGRSLPEYRALRAKNTMMQACFDAALITEITLQPVRRHGVDAAILFSDIVVPLRAAGIGVDIVPDLGPVLEALTGHARRRVVIETAAAHPLTSLNPLWLRFHGLRRPEGPTAADTIGILAAMGHDPRHTGWSRPAGADYGSMAELVEVTRRRLCLPPERAGEVETALVELGINPGRPGDLGSSGRDVVTIWWEGTA